MDERIPLSHGYLGQETNGAGGLFKGLRTIPVIFDIINDVEAICPNAWVINFTNGRDGDRGGLSPHRFQTLYRRL